MDVIEITREEYDSLICKLQTYQKIMFKILDILASEQIMFKILDIQASEQITARGSMYQKGRYDVARKIRAMIEKEI